jgi:imidazolonepropionase-like amidohydrolase
MASACLPGTLGAQTVGALGPNVKRFLSVTTSKVVLTHVNVIDGTGAPAAADRNVTIEAGKIVSVTPGADVKPGDGATVLDLPGHSVLPGLVAMHEHLFALVRTNPAPDGSAEGGIFHEMSFSAPRLYLANGVTTLRTAGSIEPQTDLKLKRQFESGAQPGPHMDVTGPYLTGPGVALPQIHDLTGPEDARETVKYWADRGVTSFKAYKYITRAEMKAALEEAHKRGLKMTGHLCSVSYEEAVELGIDNLEHSFFTDTALDGGKRPDQCTPSEGDETLEKMAPGSPEAERLIALLVKHRVAITSTLPNAASSLGGETQDGHAVVKPAALEAMAPAFRESLLYGRNRASDKARQSKSALLLKRDMELERAFVAAGGLLMAGADPVGNGGMIPGFADHRELELLVEAGFTPVEAIRIATLNGATYLGRADRIGSIAPGKNADLVVVKGDPATRIADVENVEVVFKDGAGYDPKKLLDSVKGRYGAY